MTSPIAPPAPRQNLFKTALHFILNPVPSTLKQGNLSLNFPIRLYTALQTIRLYSSTDHRVKRCNDLAFNAFQALLAANPNDGAVTLAFSNGTVFVCGNQLQEKDQTRPQIQGLIALFNRFNLHSFTFHSSFSVEQCASFIQTISALLGDKSIAEPIATLLNKAGITSVSVALKRYVAIHEGKQVIQDESIDQQPDIDDEKLADAVFDKIEQNTPRISTELILELIDLLPTSGTLDQHPEKVTKDVIEFLHKLNQETDLNRRAAEIEQSAKVLSRLDPAIISRLVTSLPPTPDADSLLRSALRQLTAQQQDALIVDLIAQQTLTKDTDAYREISTPGNPLHRLMRLEQEQTPARQDSIVRNIDARLLLTPDTTLAQLPDHLLQRLRQPEWSASVLVAAAQHFVTDSKASGNGAPLASFECALAKYDNLFDQKEQAQIATQAVAEFVTFDEQELGLILMRTYKSLLGEQLYRQVIHQLSEEKQEKLVSCLQTLHRPNSEETETMYRQQKRQHEEHGQATLKTHADDLRRDDPKMPASADIQHALPEMARDLLADNQDETANNLLMQFIAVLQNESASLALRTDAFHNFAAISEQLAQTGRWEQVEKLLPALQTGMQLQGISEQAIQQALAAIGGLAGHHLAEERYTLARKIVRILHRFATQNTHAMATGPSLQSHALDTLATLCSKTVLEKLMQLSLRPETHREAASRLLVGMGVESAKFQIQQLINNKSRSKRKRILGLIQQIGNPAISALQEQLHKDQPWYVIRNIIYLLGEISTPDTFATINPFISHPDLRVQQEVISAASKIGGDDLKDFLLQALQTVDDSLKVKVVKQIAANHDTRFVRPLTDLLESATPFPGKNKNDLHLALCKTLGMIGSMQATASLTKVAQSKDTPGLAGYSNEVRQAAATALERIQTTSEIRKSDGEKGHPSNFATGHDRSAAGEDLPVETREEAIFQLVAQGDKEQAKKHLFDLIVATARAGDFNTAERLRERIYEIDNLALDEIIHSGEIIEEEKIHAVKEEDFEIWSDLTDQLTAQEFRTMYHALSECSFNPEETVVNQGDKNDALFFITQGSIKVSHQAGSRELFITTLNRGQLAGENFFTPSFWTATLTSLTPSRVHVLQQSTLNDWQEQFPGLRAKLHAYYLSCNTISAILEKKGLERRKDQRFTLMRKIQVQPVNSHDNTIGREFHAETVDISYGGLAFLVRISRKENARLLLGRRMQITLPVGGKEPFLIFKGMVIGIQPFQAFENDFSVHFKFDHPLRQQQLQAVLG